mmetsp:Transcript_11182/g.32199  ORF Transcript_11182/g.32199 Transcript_11182/m.32199 type:complete len:223 (+) Transcript_11182:541-1209(+)
MWNHPSRNATRTSASELKTRCSMSPNRNGHLSLALSSRSSSTIGCWDRLTIPMAAITIGTRNESSVPRRTRKRRATNIIRKARRSPSIILVTIPTARANKATGSVGADRRAPAGVEAEAVAIAGVEIAIVVATEAKAPARQLLREDRWMKRAIRTGLMKAAVETTGKIVVSAVLQAVAATVIVDAVAAAAEAKIAAWEDLMIAVATATANIATSTTAGDAMQ